VGKYPRGIAVDPASQFAYVAIMSTDKILAIRLDDFSVAWGIHIAGSPRHLCISPDGKFMYASLNSLGKVAKIDLVERKLLKSVPTGRTPRSMALSPDGNYLYVVNYLANTLSRIRTSDMEVMESVETRKGPIGIAVDPETWNVWVACYTGSLEIYSDKAAYLESRIHADRETALHQSPEQLHPLQDSLTNLPFFAFEPAVEWEMEAKPEAIAIPDNVSSKSEARTYRLILGSFSEPVNARSFSAKLAKADLQTDLLPNGKGGYRVAYGEYASKAEAKVALELLRQNHNLESWILSP
jgi:YVTN family beta-propeller protein